MTLPPPPHKSAIFFGPLAPWTCQTPSVVLVCTFFIARFMTVCRDKQSCKSGLEMYMRNSWKDRLGMALASHKNSQRQRRHDAAGPGPAGLPSEDPVVRSQHFACLIILADGLQPYTLHRNERIPSTGPPHPLTRAGRLHRLFQWSESVQMCRQCKF